MTNRTVGFAVKAVVLVAAAAVFVAGSANESSAKKKKNFWDGFICECICTAGQMTDVRSYKAVAACSAYNRKACQIDDGDTITTGTLSACKSHIPADWPTAGPTAGNEQKPEQPKPSAKPPVEKPTGRGGGN